MLRKCLRWWKTLFFHLIDIAVVNSFILFREHQTMKTCTGQRIILWPIFVIFLNMLTSPLCVPLPGAGRLTQISLNLCTCQCSPKRRKTVWSATGRAKSSGRYIQLAALLCVGGKHMHVTKEKNCFQVFHSREYHNP